MKRSFLFSAMAVLFVSPGVSANECASQFQIPSFETGKFPVAPSGGAIIQYVNGKPVVPNNPIVSWMDGDGIGVEVSPASRAILDRAVELAYGGQRKIHWYLVPAGEVGAAKFGSALPDATIEALRKYKVGLKGPMSTPTGGGMRSINVKMRQVLDLYSCVRPVAYFPGVPSPMKNPERVNAMIFRENTEDLYAGIEFAAGTKEADQLRDFLNQQLISRDGPNARLLPNVPYALGIKPASEAATKRHMRRAMNYAVQNNSPNVTIIHKGNIQKFTDGAFLKWSLEVATQEYRDKVITEDELKALGSHEVPAGKILIKSRIADDMFQQAKLRPENYSVLVTQNLVGDFLSDDLAALVGGLGLAPGANIGDEGAVFEATHGTAADIAGKDMANPSSLLLSGIMMLEYFGWAEAHDLASKALRATFADRVVTGDLRNMPNSRVVGTREFAAYVMKKMTEVGAAPLAPATPAPVDKKKELEDARVRYQAYLREIQLPDYEFYLGDDQSRLYLQARFPDFDSYTGQKKEERSGKRFLSTFMTKNEVIQQALALGLSSVEHQIRKNFFYKGRRIYGPHFNIDKLAQAASAATATRAQGAGSGVLAQAGLMSWIGEIQQPNATLNAMRVADAQLPGYVVTVQTRGGGQYATLFIAENRTESEAVSLIFEALLAATQKDLRSRFLVQGQAIFSAGSHQVDELGRLCEGDCLDQRPH